MDVEAKEHSDSDEEAAGYAVPTTSNQQFTRVASKKKKRDLSMFSVQGVLYKNMQLISEGGYGFVHKVKR